MRAHFILSAVLILPPSSFNGRWTHSIFTRSTGNHLDEKDKFSHPPKTNLPGA
jgi:hypothetical protein